MDRRPWLNPLWGSSSSGAFQASQKQQRKARGEIWGQITLNLNSLASPIFKVSKRSVRDRLTLLQTKCREKIRERIRHKLWRDPARCSSWRDSWQRQGSRHGKEWASWHSHKKSAEWEGKCRRVRRQAMERLGKTQKRNADSEEGKPSKRGKGRSSDAVEYLKEKFESLKWSSRKMNRRCWWINRVKCTSSN